MPRSNSKDRFLQTTARLLRERGYAATGLEDVVSMSGSPRGSLYFHFPGGKEELVAFALANAGNEGCRAIQFALRESKTIAAALKSIFAMSIKELEASGFRAGCPIGTIAAESPTAAKVCEAVATAFGKWHAALKERLIQSGLRPRRADELAEFILAAFEGGVVLAKASKTSKPLENALRGTLRLLRQEHVR